MWLDKKQMIPTHSKKLNWIEGDNKIEAEGTIKTELTTSNLESLDSQVEDYVKAKNNFFCALKNGKKNRSNKI